MYLYKKYVIILIVIYILFIILDILTEEKKLQIFTFNILYTFSLDCTDNSIIILLL